MVLFDKRAKLDLRLTKYIIIGFLRLKNKKRLQNPYRKLNVYYNP